MVCNCPTHDEHTFAGLENDTQALNRIRNEKGKHKSKIIVYLANLIFVLVFLFKIFISINV